MQANQIYREDDKPAWEFVRGRMLQKISPKPIHSVLQGELYVVLRDWGAGKGTAFTELHVLSRLPNEAKARQLVPDVCYYFSNRFALTSIDRDYPRVHPDVSIECASPRDALEDINWKRARYTAWGVPFVVDADPYAAELRIHGADVFPELAELLQDRFDQIVQLSSSDR